MKTQTDHIQLTHPFKDIIPDIDELLKSNGEVIQTINALCDKIKDCSAKYSSRIKEEDFKGDALELFTEYMIKSNESDNRIGIYDYTIIKGDDDTGVDGVGMGENKFPATVQVKFRAGDYVLTANEDHLSNFMTSSFVDFGVRIEDEKNMLIVTTGNKVDERTMEKMLKGKVRCLSREALRQMFDNRPEWWSRFYESVKMSRIQKDMEQLPKQLRQHQSEAVEAFLNWKEDRGKIILPTGCGKTLVEAEISRHTILECQSRGVMSPIIKINTSRILLCFQLFREIGDYLLSYGINAKYANYNSGNQDDSDFVEKICKKGGIYHGLVSTTKPIEIQHAYRDACINQVPLIVFSTYHSSERFADSGLPVEITIHDEAHNLVSKEFYKAAKLPSKKNIFFTATEKVTDSNEDIGMNNEELFGKMIYWKSPRQMIEVGEMVKPMVHVVRPKNGEKWDINKLDHDYEAIAKSINDAFDAHSEMVEKDSASPDDIGAKVLVVCRGQQDLIQMKEHGMFAAQKAMRPDIKTYALSSDFGLWIDGTYIKPPVSNAKKQKLLDEIRNLNPNDKAIIYHVDIIGEGIDVPGLTGVMPFRNSEESKFFQNTGRASRLHPIDRAKLYNNEISTKDYTKWVKPCSWIIIPSFLENSEGYSGRFRNMIAMLRDDYGFIPQQNTLITNENGLSDELVIDAVNYMVKRRPTSKSGLKEFEHEFEKMTLTERLLFDDAVQVKVDENGASIDALLA